MDKTKIKEIAEALCNFKNSWMGIHMDCDKCRSLRPQEQCYFTQQAKYLYETVCQKIEKELTETIKVKVLDDFYNTYFCGYMFDGEVKEPCVQGPCPHFKGVEDIRKEAAKEILAELLDMPFNVFDDICFPWFEKLCGKYGIDWQKLREVES